MGNKVLMAISVVALVFIFIRQSLLNIPEGLPFGEELGEFLYDASVGYLITYWFFYLTVYRIERRDKENVYRFVNRRCVQIVITLEEFIKELTDNTPSAILSNEYLSTGQLQIQDFKNILRVLPHHNYINRFNQKFEQMTWCDYFYNINDKIISYIRDIFLLMPHLETDDIALFTEIYDSRYLETVQNIDLSDCADLEFLSTDLHELYIKIQALKEKFGQTN